MSTSTPAEDSPGAVDLLRRSVEDGSRLIQQEIQLAKQELSESAKSLARGIVGAVIVALAALGFLVMGIVTIVVAASPHWAAALAFTALFLVVALGFGWFAIRSFRSIRPLSQTRETIEEDITWAKRQLRPDTR